MTCYVFDSRQVGHHRFSAPTADLTMDRSRAAASEAFFVVFEPGEAPPVFGRRRHGRHGSRHRRRSRSDDRGRAGRGVLIGEQRQGMTGAPARPEFVGRLEQWEEVTEVRVHFVPFVDATASQEER